MKVIPTDIYDKDGNLLKIEFHNEHGKFEIQAVWDPQDPNTTETRAEFRKWAYRMVKQVGFEVLT